MPKNEIIIDANVLFASLIKEGVTRRIILNEKFSFCVPAYIIEEFLEHIGEIEQKTNVKKRILKRKLKEFLRLANITVIEKEELEDFLGQANKISPDPNDIHYFALALKLNCPIWSNDKKLKEQKQAIVYNTRDMIEKYQL